MKFIRQVYKISLNDFMKIFPLIIFGLASAATELSWAQEAESEYIICTGALRSYQPDVSVIKSLRDTPVPEDFKEAYADTGPCLFWGGLEQALVTTHLKYGDAESAAKALAFLEADILKSKRSEDEVTLNAKKRADLLPKVEAAQKLYIEAEREAENQADKTRLLGLYREAQTELLATDPPDYASLTALYMDAAEFHASPDLLEKATELWELLKRNSDIHAAAFGDIEQAEDEIWEEQIALQNLQERIAILKARIEPTPDHIETAHNLMLGRYHRAYRKYGEAYSDSDIIFETICDIPESEIKFSEDDQKEMAADPFFNRPNSSDCNAQSLEPAIRNYWKRLAIIEAMMVSDPENFRRMTRSEISISQNQPNGFKRPNLTVRRVETDPAPEASNIPRDGLASEFYFASLKPFIFEDPSQLNIYANPLHEAAELIRLKSQYRDNAYRIIEDNRRAFNWVQPYEHPGLWKKLAEDYLAHVENFEDRDVNLQQVSYLKRTLENLSSISVGE